MSEERGRGRAKKVAPDFSRASPERKKEYFDRSMRLRQEMRDIQDDLKALRRLYLEQHSVDVRSIDKAVALAMNDTPEKVSAFKRVVEAMEEFNIVRFDSSGQGNAFAVLEVLQRPA